MLQWTVVGGNTPSSDDTLSQNAWVARPSSVGTMALANEPEPTITSLRTGVIRKLGDETSMLRAAAGCVGESLHAASATAAKAAVAKLPVRRDMSFSMSKRCFSHFERQQRLGRIDRFYIEPALR